ncbi:MAG: TonB-dependent receptor [Cytophagia bacterium]|nr:MAG: TonB-dependent receptor [Runella sp.]TAG21106.1 MAG: TonB-dependent receptor [Cytophagales bacterium]TAG40215.1 MAG: TonB-dependent receptor [Cytophagia bacterium]TAG58713.1 MAG: TonB-dependent receptor [Runella slithyformis]TAG75551.1 MAG: TonB-dependent receptor [Runella slithyformis]
MKYFTTLAAALLLFHSVAFSQNPARGNVAGSALETTQKPLPFATVLLLKATDSTLVKGAVTTEQGRYELENVPFGRYVVAVTAVGYQKTFGTPFNLATPSLQLPDLTVSAVTQTLAEVKVVAQKPFIEQQIDRTVLNVENSAVAAGSTALEVLEKAPGVTVDQQNDRLVVKGKQGVIVQMDGKQTFLSTQELMNLLRNTPADNIEKVEIITNPSAKYDAAGNSGIINIKTKKNKNLGTNGTATLGTGYGRYEKANASINLNHRVSKMNVFGNYSYFQNRGFNEQEIYRNILFEGRTTIFDQNGSNINRNNGHSFKTGIDWFLNKKNTVGVLVSGFNNHFDGSSLSNTLITAPTDQTRLSTTNAPSNKFQNITANLNYKYEMGNGRELTADADYSSFGGQSGNYLDSRFTNLQGQLTLIDLVRNTMPSTIGIWAGKIDYVHPLKKGKIETGWKSSWVNTDNDMKFEVNTDTQSQWRTDPTRTNRFKYDENINALYLNYATALGKKTQLQTGLRLENTHSVGNSVTLNSVTDRNYTNLFPSVFVSQTLDTNNVLNLSYSRRIDRPSYQDLNPFEFFLDPFTFQRGNPFLRPQFTNSFTLTHVFKSAITTTLSYARTTDLIQEQAPDQIASENKTFVTSVNMDKFDNYSLNVSFPVTIAKWWTMQNNLTVFHNRYQTRYRTGVFDLSVTAYNLYSSNNFKLSKTLTAEVSAFYNSAGLFGFFRNDPMGAINLGVQKSWLGGKLRGRFNFQDPFWLNQFRGSTEFQDLNFSVRSRWESRVARVSLTYRFGNQNVKAARQRQTSTDDLRDRVKQ